MGLLRRSARLPDDVRQRLGLGSREATLAVGELTDGWAVATARGLNVLAGDAVLVRDWTDVDGARLDTEGAALTVTWVDGTPSTTLHLADDRAVGLPRAVHDRVQSSVVHSERLELSRGGTVRVVLRRGAAGDLFTQVIGSGRADLTDPAVARAVDAAEARVREAAGL